MEEGETEVETALREVKEEVNLKPIIYEDYRYTINYTVKDNVPKEVVFFLADVDQDTVTKQDIEIEMTGWFTEKEAEKMMEFENQIQILHKAFKDSRGL